MSVLAPSKAVAPSASHIADILLVETEVEWGQAGAVQRIAPRPAAPVRASKLVRRIGSGRRRRPEPSLPLWTLANSHY